MPSSALSCHFRSPLLSRRKNKTIKNKTRRLIYSQLDSLNWTHIDAWADNRRLSVFPALLLWNILKLSRLVIACSHQHSHLMTFTHAHVLLYIQPIIACIIPSRFNIINHIAIHQIRIRYSARHELRRGTTCIPNSFGIEASVIPLKTDQSNIMTRKFVSRYIFLISK